MTFSYKTKTQIGYAYASVILPEGDRAISIQTPYGLATLDGTLARQQAEYLYGSELLPIAPIALLPNQVFEHEYNEVIMYKLLPKYSPQTLQFSLNSLNGAINTLYIHESYASGQYAYHRPSTGTGNIYEPNAELYSRPVIVYSKTRYLVETVGYISPKKPSYKDLLEGYYLDGDRVIKSYPIITSPIAQKATISYYRQNKYESIGFPSIDWMVYEVDLTADVPKVLPIIDCILGTLHCDNQNITSLIKNTIVPPVFYPYSTFFEDGLPDLFNHWNGLAQAIDIPPSIPANAVSGGTKTEVSRAVRVLAANNNCWNNQSVSIAVDRLPPSPNTHPLFKVDQTRGYNWHIKPQSDGSFGDLVMNSPKLEEIHAAINAGKWAVNPDDPTKPRIDNLGWRIERGNEVLGIRVKPDGKIDEPKEKKDNRREHAERGDQNDPQKYNPNCFGSEGILVRYMPNKFKPKGKDMETIEGGFRKVKDIPQLLAELHEQANAAMGYQEGTAIEITVDDETYRYPNQLALLTEIFVTLKQSGVYSKGAFFSSVVAEQSIKEVIGGLGLRTVDKYLEFKIAGKTAKLYYKGISASQSIRRKLSAISTNIGTIIGNIT